MMKIVVGILIYVQGDYFQCSSCLAEKGKRICDNEAYTPPKKVRHSHHSDTSTPSLNVIGFAKQNLLWTIVTTSPTLTHTSSHRFIFLTSAQGNNQPTPRVQMLTRVNS